MPPCFLSRGVLLPSLPDLLKYSLLHEMLLETLGETIRPAASYRPFETFTALTILVYTNY